MENFNSLNSIYLVSMVFVGISMLVSMMLKGKFAKYSKMPLSSGMTGAEVAAKMLADHGITDVKIISTPGKLTDHYNPANKTVNLSEEVFGHATVAAAGVAAHEVGHAVQHATAYKWLQMRSKLVPAVQFSSSIIQWVLLAGIAMINIFPNLLLIGIGLFAVTTLFALVTLPVEFDASKRALVWMNKAGVTGQREHAEAKDALKWAAMTYVVAAIASIVTLVQYLMIYLGGRRD